MRHFLIVAGSADWCRSSAIRLLSNRPDAIWVGDCAASLPQTRKVVAASEALQLLGQEFHSIVFDMHCGFHADAFAAVSGTIRDHGYLLLLAPPLQQWPLFEDPDYQRMLVWPATSKHTRGRFLQRLANLFVQRPGTEIIAQGESNEMAPLPSPAAGITSSTTDQQLAVDAILRVASGHRSRPLVITADRGRGKSAALGLAAASLLSENIRRERRIIVTAPSPGAVDTLFRHAAAALPRCDAGKGRLACGEQSLRFVAPDQLLKEKRAADLLFVDEAAAIPAALLEAMLQRYRRIVFSTTVHGYEGAGRGFAVRFRDTLERLTPQWRELRLTTPIRWSRGDPLERLTFDALLMNAEPAGAEAFGEFTLEQLDISNINQDQLLQDEELLRQLFGLLVQAHYRTRPFDLRYLLDGDNVEILLGRYRGVVAAVAVAVREGGFDDAMTSQILSGERRPRGHLAPQILARHCAQPQALQQKFLRIMRIAVHPAIRRRGVATALLDVLAATAEGVDTICTSFGATAGLLALWRKNSFLPVRIGLTREASSGCHSVLMLKPVESGKQLLQESRGRFHRQLPLLLSDSLNGLETGVCLPLLRDASCHGDMPPEGKALLKRFVRGELPYDAVFPELEELAMLAARSGRATRLDPRQQDLFFSRVLQREPIQSIAARVRLAGKQEVQHSLQEAVNKLL
ncbi:MAG: GNAT family N-acetyltransferase [Pseudomonadota bacterium]